MSEGKDEELAALCDPMNLIDRIRREYPTAPDQTEYTKLRMDGIFRSKESKIQRIFGDTLDWYAAYAPPEYRDSLRQKYFGILSQVRASDTDAIYNAFQELSREIKQSRMLCARLGLAVPGPLSVPGKLPPQGIFDSMEIQDAIRHSKAASDPNGPAAT